MIRLGIISSILFFSAAVMASSSEPPWVRQYMNVTEAGYCADCQKRGVSPINLDYVGGDGGSVKDATQKFIAAAKKHAPYCLDKEYIAINDLSRGTANNRTYILRRAAPGKYVVADSFETGQGKGVGNRAKSNFSPTGLIGFNGLDYYKGRKQNGSWYTWPPFKASNGKKINFIDTRGLEPKNANISARSTEWHAITYSTGNTTNGCTGFPIKKFKKWSYHLKNSCAYGYEGKTEGVMAKLSDFTKYFAWSP